MDFFFKSDSINCNFIDNSRDIVDEFGKGINQRDKESVDFAWQSIIKIKDIIYDNNAYDDIQTIIPSEAGLDIMVDNCGWFKSRKWKYEKETRLVLSFHYGIKELNTNYICSDWFKPA